MYLPTLSTLLPCIALLFLPSFIQAGLAQPRSSSLTSPLHESTQSPVLRPTPLSTTTLEHNQRFSKKFRKRCWYIGTFFKRIDCNAIANSTRIPYSPSARQHISDNLPPTSSMSMSGAQN
ncbi:hypothetical protein JCM3765_007369 [Sporobolomyces pararoseus]